MTSITRYNPSRTARHTYVTLSPVIDEAIEKMA
jgi:hypothetical protein